MTEIRNIVLIGFMGAGKTVIGRAIASALNRPFFDTDTMVEETAGVKIEAIFGTLGEDAFRELEMRTIQELSSIKGAVIATGGGAIKNQENVAALKREGFIVYLYARPEVLLARIKQGGERPLAADIETVDGMQMLLAEREPIYRKMADLVVDTSDALVNDVENEILQAIGY